MPEATRTLVVTSALPYANGPIHIGHLVEYIQSDIWARFQRMRGNRCIYICADDAHGTPIMLKAEEEGISPEELIERIGEEHRADFRDFEIAFDEYYTTHSQENRECAERIYTRLRDGGHIVRKGRRRKRTTRLKGMFLPDRYVKGTCPVVRSGRPVRRQLRGLRGDLQPSRPRSTQCRCSPARQPELRSSSEHYFVRLADSRGPVLRQWLASGGRGGSPPVQPEIANKLEEWFEAGLQDWDISRDAPYFGFGIPDAPGKYFYVWLDAPIGYMGTWKHLLENGGHDEFETLWDRDSAIELHQFIGKDVAYFHTLFWPAMLHGSGHRMATSVNVHGFLTVNGRKMSKRSGTFIRARTYLDHLDPEYLRYYFACKLTGSVEDIDLSFDDFRQRVNSDLVGKVVNIASRCGKRCIHRHLGGRSSPSILPSHVLYQEAINASEPIAALYETREFGKAMREIAGIADRTNQYIDERKPWVLVKDEARLEDVRDVCTVGLNLCRLLMTLLKPVLPRTAARTETFLRCGELAWDSMERPLLGHEIARFEPLLTRVEKVKIDAMVADSVEAAEENAGAANKRIGIDTFQKVDLRVAKVVEARCVEGADWLLEVIVDLGDERRTLYAGIRGAYTPQNLVGRHVVVVANLAPRTMRFGVSDGMILSAGSGESDIWLLGVDEGAEAGMRVR